MFQQFAKCVLMVVLLTSSLWAVPSPFHFGVRLGGGVSGFSGHQAVLQTTSSGVEAFSFENVQTSMVAGLYTTKSITPLTSLVGEMNYVMKGAKGQYKLNNNPKQDVEYGFTYLDFPVYLKASFVLFSVYGGGYVSYLLDSKVSGLAKELEINTMDYGVLAGFQYGIGPLTALDVRLTYGLNSIYNTKTGFPEMSHYAVTAGLNISI